jgi:hypothetical protein
MTVPQVVAQAPVGLVLGALSIFAVKAQAWGSVIDRL